MVVGSCSRGQTLQRQGFSLRPKVLECVSMRGQGHDKIYSRMDIVLLGVSSFMAQVLIRSGTWSIVFCVPRGPATERDVKQCL